MKNYLIIFFFLFTSFGQLSAQQLSLFNQFYETYMLLNPAQVPIDYAIADFRYYGGITYRNQWTQVEGTPKTVLARFNWMDMDFNTNVGGHIIHDQIGDTKLSGVYGKYAYMIEIDNKQTLGAGLSLGFAQFRLAIDPSEVFFDPKVNNESFTYLDAGLGMYYQYRSDRDATKLFYLGLSIPQLFGADFNSSITGSHLEPHIYFSTGGSFKTGNNGRIEANAWVRHIKNVPLHGMIYGRYWFDKIFWVGTGIALNGTLHGEVGVYPNNALFQNPYFDLKIGLSFERPISNYGNQFGNTIELNLTFIHL